MTLNRQLVLRARPAADVGSRHFELVRTPIPALGPGEALVRVCWLGIEPTQRTWLNAGNSYIAPIELGEVMRSPGVGQVIESRSEAIRTGDWVYGTTGWQEYVVARSGGIHGLNVVPAGIEPKAMLSVLGASGLAAYFGMIEVGKPKQGETVVVSAAAGSVGSIAGQVARNLGANVIGLASSADKCRWLVQEAAFHSAINYRIEDVRLRLRELAPGGVDVYFDNVGGQILEVALDCIAMRGRVVLSGSISSGYRDAAYGILPGNYMNLAFRRARMEGFIFLDYLEKFPAAFSVISEWLHNGRLVYKEDIIEGLENAPAALGGLFKSRNLGKQLVRIT